MAVKRTIGENELLAGFRVLLRHFGRLYTVVSDNASANVNINFKAVPLPQQDTIDLVNELGLDARDYMVLDCESPQGGSTQWTPASLDTNAVITDGFTQWRLVKLNNNVADVTLRLWFVQLVDGVDA